MKRFCVSRSPWHFGATKTSSSGEIAALKRLLPLLLASVIGASAFTGAAQSSKTVSKSSADNEEREATPRPKRKIPGTPSPSRKAKKTEPNSDDAEPASTTGSPARTATKSKSSDSVANEEPEATPRPKRKTPGTPRPSQKAKKNEANADDAEPGSTTDGPARTATKSKSSDSATTATQPKQSGSKKSASTPAPSERSKAKVPSDAELAPLPSGTSAPEKSSTRRKPSAESTESAAKTTAAVDPAAPPPERVAPEANASLSPHDLVEFGAQPARVQKLLESALALTQQNLTYLYGSAEPANGGLDCSGFVYFVLRQNGFADVPRAANEQYVWVRKADNFDAVLSKKKESFELDALQPGDLLFWTGTYTTERDPPVTHAMIYLGTERSSKQRVMVGSSDGRTYRGKSRWGVSVFDFQGGLTSRDPAKAGRGGFVGYATIPGLR